MISCSKNPKFLGFLRKQLKPSIKHLALRMQILVLESGGFRWCVVIAVFIQLNKMSMYICSYLVQHHYVAATQ